MIPEYICIIYYIINIYPPLWMMRSMWIYMLPSFSYFILITIFRLLGYLILNLIKSNFIECILIPRDSLIIYSWILLQFIYGQLELKPSNLSGEDIQLSQQISSNDESNFIFMTTCGECNWLWFFFFMYMYIYDICWYISLFETERTF